MGHPVNNQTEKYGRNGLALEEESFTEYLVLVLCVPLLTWRYQCNGLLSLIGRGGDHRRG